MKLRWDRLGGQLGVLFCLAGIVLIWSGWNGAGSHDEVEGQFPYLISGGLAGLALVVIGVGLFVTQALREDRATLEANLVELRQAIERVGRGGGEEAVPAIPVGALVVAGPNSYHQPECRLLEGREGLALVTQATAVANGLSPCRTCAPSQN